MKRLAVVALSALMCVNAFALFNETEPNNTRATADNVLYNLRTTPPFSEIGILFLGPNDSDFFRIRLEAGDVLTAVTIPFQPNYTAPDTVMALFDATGTNAIVWNDDISGTNLGSVISWQASVSGDYFIAITGYRGSSVPFNNISYYEGATHPQLGAYILTVSVVPEPASMLALGAGLAGLAALRRRKK